MIEIPFALALFFTEPVSQTDKLDWLKHELEEILATEKEKRLYNRPFNPRFAEHETNHQPPSRQ